MKGLAVAALSLCLVGAGWVAHPYFDRARDYGEAERLQQSFRDADMNAALAPHVHLYAGKMVLQDSNGDRLIIVNGTHQLRVTAGGSHPLIERLGTH